MYLNSRFCYKIICVSNAFDCFWYKSVCELFLCCMFDELFSSLFYKYTDTTDPYS